MSSSTILIFLLILFALIIIVQVARMLDYISEIKGREQAEYRSYRINGILMLVFLGLGLIGVYWCNEVLKDDILKISASVEGETIDFLNYLTIVITGVVFFITNILLFWFAFRYRAKKDNKAYYYTHNNRLEIIWTTIPAITMFVLVALGLRFWFKITAEPPEDAQVVEITGKQFEWIVRYPGRDGILGKKYFKKIDDANNRLGQLWEDKANHDDIVVSNEVHLVVDKPAHIIIGSRDVIHDVGLPHFRLKADAVPGVPTSLSFTPQYTTSEMREFTGNPDFTYEIACDQMCGKGHYTMRGIVIVENQEDYDLWLASKKPYYTSVKPEEKVENDSSQSTTQIDNEKIFKKVNLVQN